MHPRVTPLSFGLARTLPLIRQSEVAECGLAALTMVVGYHGHKTDLAAMRSRFPITPRGLTLKDLSDIVGKLGFASRPLRVGIKNVRQLRLPAILHWDLNHFVVLKSASRRRLTIHDPARGLVTMSHSEFAEHFTGLALEIMPTAEIERKDDRYKLPMSSLWSNMTGLSGTLIQILLFSVIMQVFMVASPQYIQVTIDKVLPTQDLDLLIVLAIGFGLLLIMKVVAASLRGLVILYAGTTLAQQITSNLFHQLIRLPLNYFESRHVGDIISRFESLQPIKDFLIDGVVKTFIDGVMAIIMLILMFVYSPLLTAVVLIALSLYLTISMVLFRRMRLINEEVIQAGAKENTNFIETVRGILPIKAFADEANRQLKWQNLLTDTLNSAIRLARLNIGLEQAQTLIFEIERIIVIFLAARLVINGEFTIGMIFAFTAYRGQFVGAVTSLVDVIIQFRMLRLHLDRISDIVLTDTEPQGGVALDIEEGQIALDNLSFSYGAGTVSILKNVSFVIQPGESVALVGDTGCGKTTLLKLIMGLLQPDEGDIRIDGVNLTQIDQSYFRRQIASVMQDDQLFSGSITENISFNDLNVDYEKLQSCAEKAQIHEEISRMPMAYETLVGDMGAALSGGQIQRILIARALYREPAILFIDEGTSNLDVETERRVNAAISEIGITRVISAHRKETIESADRIISVGGGNISEI